MATLPLFVVRATENGQGNKILEQALIQSFRPSIDKALDAYYKDSSKIDPDWPKYPTWTTYFGTEIVKTEEIKGFGGGVSYDITSKKKHHP